MAQVAERIIGVDEHTDTTNLLQNLSLDSQTKQSDAQPPHFDGEATDTANDATVSAPTSENNNSNNNSTPADVVVDPNMYYLHNGYPPQPYFYGAYDGPVGEWDEYRFINPEGVEIPGGGVYSNDGNSVIYHPNYGYPPHMHYGPYSPASAPVPSMGADGQIYSPQPFQYSGPFYQPPVPPGAPYTPSMTPPLPQSDVSTSSTDQVNVEGVAANGNSNANSNGGPLGTLPNYPIPSAPSNGSYGRGVVPGSNDMFRPPSSWVDGPAGSDGHMRPSVNNGMLSVPQTTSPGPLGPNIRPMPPMMHHMQAVPPQRPPTGVGPAPVYLNRMYPNRMYPHNNSGRTNSGFGPGSFDSRANGRGWNGFEKGKGRGRGNGTLYGYTEGMDVLNEQNRGPRTARIRNQRVATGPWQIKGQNVITNGRGDEANSVPNRDQYNRPEFVTKHSDAKFFIIKSYSEDDIHKSIKYSIWASTPNGNRKLDSAYKESQEKPAGCPIFLFFSVNASGQFCGVAEMIGPVDFNQSVDYWQQDKWNGKFPVKWHIVKDIPNNQLRHITLENNDSKPVTNSRDTQEVMLEKGIEMLKIFKDYVSKTSILDDFIFYEGRQKAMQEKRARQLQKQASSDANGKPRDVKTGEPSPEENNLKARFQQSADRNNHKVTSADERSFPGSPGDAWKGGKPTLLKREVNGNAVDKQVQTNGS